MNINTKTFYNYALQKIKKTNEEIYRIQEAITTGKKINRPSDNPQGTKQVLKFRTLLSTIDQYSENINFATDWSQITNDVLETTNDLLQRCKEIAVSHVNGSSTEETRATFITEVQGIFQDLIQIANTKYDDRYLFSPESMDTPPFDEATLLEEPLDNTGPEFAMEIQIGEEKKIQMNMSKRVFSGGEEGENLFEVVDQLWRALLKADDTESITAALENIDLALEQTTQHLSIVGNRMRDLERNQKQLNKLKYNIETSLSQKEDIDIAEKIIEFSLKTDQYTISLSTLSKILNINLLEIIG